MGKYDKIINLPHHQSTSRPQMSLYDRAAQFSPFAALTGYDDMVKEVARETDEQLELDENTIEELNRKQQILMTNLTQKPMVTITYFVPDEKKDGGKYVTKQGNLHKIDTYTRAYILTDKTVIPFQAICEIECPLFKEEL